MSKNKGGRPDVWNADYFPHAVKTSNELRYLEHTHGAEGYRAYWRILEQRELRIGIEMSQLLKTLSKNGN